MVQNARLDGLGNLEVPLGHAKQRRWRIYRFALGGPHSSLQQERIFFATRRTLQIAERLEQTGLPVHGGQLLWRKESVVDTRDVDGLLVGRPGSLGVTRFKIGVAKQSPWIGEFSGIPEHGQFVPVNGLTERGNGLHSF